MSSIAIVGMGCRFAGAPDLHAYWDLTFGGRSAFGPVPADRWPHDAFLDPNKRATDKTYAPAGGFLDDVRSFPALHLGIPPRRVEVMDPQQRLSIEVAIQAIEDAGYRPADLPRRTGVFVGVTASEFRSLVSSRLVAGMIATGMFGRPPEDPEVLARAVENVVPSRPFTAPGALANMIAAAVAQELDLHGPAYTVDAACASAMMAVADAVAQLRAGQIDAAVAGGVYLQLSPENYVAFSRIGAISGTGRCLPFDARADGFVQGDGAGALILKRLADAERDGDRIYAVIHGIATNNDGRGDGPMAPVLSGQVDVIRTAWGDAGVDPKDLGYLEAHGTGTDVGDQIELSGLQQALGDRAGRVWLGSAKANVGHTMSAAGVAGMIRAALSVHHRTVPPLAGFESAKSDIAFEPFAIPTAPEPWNADVRLAGVSSFGFGGTNGHAVLGAAPVVAPNVDDQLELVRISAPDEAALRRTAARLAAVVREDAAATVASVARAWDVRPSLVARAAVVARTRDELLQALDQVAGGRGARAIPVGTTSGAAPKVAVLFPGQGAQRVGMLRGLRDRFPVVAEALDRAEQDLEDLLPLPLSHVLYPERRAEPVPADVAEGELTFTANCQPALVAAGIALWRLLEQVGVKPMAAGGHSLGEFAAAVVGGVLSERDAVRFAAMRGRAMADLGGDPGAMAAIVGPVDRVRALVADNADGVVIANENHPSQTVISGPTEAVAAMTRKAAAAGLETKALNVSHAFHSPKFAALDAEPWLGSIALADPSGPIVASCIQDRPYADRTEARAVFARHASSPVRFGRMVAQCAEAGADLYLQVGAGGPLASFVRKSLATEPRAVLTLASSDDADAGRSALEALGWLWVHGVALDTRSITGRAPVASLPPIELPREPYWPVKDQAQIALKLTGPTAGPRPVPSPNVVHADVPDLGPAADDVFEKVAAVVSKVSSYPRASIRAELSLVDELGFDSLMVSDLANGLAEAFPGLGGLPQELLLNRPTVSAIVEHVRTAATGVAAATDDEQALLAYRTRWVPCALPEVHPPKSGALAGRSVLVIGDLDAEVTAALKHAGAVITRRTKTVVDAIVAVGPFEDPVPVNAVYAGELPTPDRAAALSALLDDQVRLGGAPSLLVVVRADDPWAEGEAGVVRAVAREWPERTVKLVRFDGLSAAVRAARIVQELVSEDRSVDVRWRPDGRAVTGQEPGPTEVRWTPGPGDRVLITGGTRGIGAKLARRLIEAGANVVLVGRGAPSDEIRELPADRVKVVPVDVTDRVALYDAIVPLRPFAAVVHCAGVLADGPIGKVDPEQGARARRVKVDGFVNALTAAGSVQVALAVGSWAGRFGNRHQLHYAAGNAQLTAFAEHPPKGVRVVVAEFGPWSSSEMVRTIPPAIQAAMRTEGVDFAGDGSGLDALWDDLRGGSGVVIHGRRLPFWNRVREHVELLSTETHPYLLDHAIDGVPVLPLAAATDLLAATAGAPLPYEVRDLRLFAGVTVKEPVRIKVLVTGERAELRMGERDSLAYRATIAPARDVEIPAPVEAVEASGLLGITVDRFYQDVTFHGRMLQGVTALDGVGKDVLRGRVRTSKPGQWAPKADRTGWAVDPLALDSAFQLGAMVAWDRYQRGGTPVSLGRMVVLAPFPSSGTIRVDGRFGEPEGDRSVGSFVFRDAEGKAFALAIDAVAELVKSSQEPAFEIKREWVDPTAWPELKDLDQRLEAATLLGIPNPYFHVHEGTARDTTVVGGKRLVNFSSYNYLGFSGDPRVIAEVETAVRLYGTSVSASRVASGERPYHRELEHELAQAQGVDDALVFTAGHMTNVNAIATVMKPADLVLHDELIHESLHQGIKMSGAGRRGFRHDDPEHLEKLIKELRPHHEKCLIVVEGVYSMDGDLCALPEYVRLKQKYGCLLMVDEAHSFGVCGPTGRGIGEHYQVNGGFDPRSVDLWMGTLSKSLSSCGGWIAGSAAMIRLLRYGAGGFVYSAGITPANGTAALASLRLMLQEPWRVQKLQANARMFHDLLVARGIDTGPAKGGSAVVPAVTGNSMHALLLSARLREQGVNVQPIIYPAVADNAARLRFFLSSTHEEAQLRETVDKVATILGQLREEMPAPR